LRFLQCLGLAALRLHLPRCRHALHRLFVHRR
jgi:hypothetical protein